MSGMYGVVAFHAGMKARDEASASGMGRAQHDPNCHVCQHSSKGLPDEIGSENVQTFMPQLAESN
ncbi:hypothetical protein [Singulisphaera sp. PoT]|uniref:hypothetical protein n=1 Tax=Singulisphaera sp. PoT TaxID=3411797 RepID=UPI003BF596D3